MPFAAPWAKHNEGGRQGPGSAIPAPPAEGVSRTPGRAELLS